MGSVIKEMHSYFEFSSVNELFEHPKQVLSLAAKSIDQFAIEELNNTFSHLVVATTCPDFIAPSLGQMLNEKFNSLFSKCHTIDIVQGCAGGVTAMILGSQLSLLHKSSVLVILSDAANKATSKLKKINKIFGNGSFACLMEYDYSDRGLLHYKSIQYKGLSEVVTVNLGHDSDDIIMRERTDMAVDPRKHLGLSMNNALALKLLRNAEKFYLEFVNESTAPDVMILHQVNPEIVKHLKSVFKKYNTEFVDVSESTGNCGVASIGIAFNKVKDLVFGKKILLCSFGTGGVITAGLWQN